MDLECVSTGGDVGAGQKIHQDFAMPENEWASIRLIKPAPKEAVDMDCIRSTNFFQSQWESCLLTGLN